MPALPSWTAPLLRAHRRVVRHAEADELSTPEEVSLALETEFGEYMREGWMGVVDDVVSAHADGSIAGDDEAEQPLYHRPLSQPAQSRVQSSVRRTLRTVQQIVDRYVPDDPDGVDSNFRRMMPHVAVLAGERLLAKKLAGGTDAEIETEIAALKRGMEVAQRVALMRVLARRAPISTQEAAVAAFAMAGRVVRDPNGEPPESLRVKDFRLSLSEHQREFARLLARSLDAPVTDDTQAVLESYRDLATHAEPEPAITTLVAFERNAVHLSPSASQYRGASVQSNPEVMDEQESVERLWRFLASADQRARRRRKLSHVVDPPVEIEPMEAARRAQVSLTGALDRLVEDTKRRKERSGEYEALDQKVADRAETTRLDRVKDDPYDGIDPLTRYVLAGRHAILQGAPVGQLLAQVRDWPDPSGAGGEPRLHLAPDEYEELEDVWLYSALKYGSDRSTAFDRNLSALVERRGGLGFTVKEAMERIERELRARHTRTDEDLTDLAYHLLASVPEVDDLSRRDRDDLDQAIVRIIHRLRAYQESRQLIFDAAVSGGRVPDAVLQDITAQPYTMRLSDPEVPILRDLSLVAMRDPQHNSLQQVFTEVGERLIEYRSQARSPEYAVHRVRHIEERFDVGAADLRQDIERLRPRKKFR